MCNVRQLRLWLVHVTKQFLSLNLTLPHPPQGSVPPEGFFCLISFGEGGGFIWLWEKSAACSGLRSSNEKKLMNLTAEHRDYLGWKLPNWCSSPFAATSLQFPGEQGISPQDWDPCRSCCVLMPPCSPQKENWALWGCCCSSSRLLGWGGLLLSLKTEWISPGLSTPWDESERERRRSPAGRVTHGPVPATATEAE